MKKQLCTHCLALLLLIPGAGTFCSAAEAERTYTCSDWAETDVFSALYYGLARAPYGGDYRQPIQRQAFGENAAALVARTYGTDLDLYLNVTSFRLQKASGWGTVGLYDPVLAVAKELGILQGREDGSLDGATLITRQEAAVILARTYRACMGKVSDALSPLSYDDSAQIASWAQEDVQLMTQLGILQGVGDNRFHPQGSYTVEQCFSSLVRLLQKITPYPGPSPFAMTQEEAVIGGFCGSREMVAYADTENTAQVTAAAWAAGKGTLSGAKYYISVFDQDLKRTDYREVIKGSSDGRYGVHDAHLENLSLSPDGSQVFYQAKVNRMSTILTATATKGTCCSHKGCTRSPWIWPQENRPIPGQSCPVLDFSYFANGLPQDVRQAVCCRGLAGSGPWFRGREPLGCLPGAVGTAGNGALPGGALFL